MNSEQPMYYPNMNELPPPPNGHFNPNGYGFTPVISNSYATPQLSHTQYTSSMHNMYQTEPMYMSQYPTSQYPSAPGLHNGPIRIVRPPNEQQNGVPSGAPRVPLFIPQPHPYQAFHNTVNIGQYSTSSQIPPVSYVPDNNAQIPPPYASSQPLMNPQYSYTPPPPPTTTTNQPTEKRPRKPLAIVDPTSNQQVQVETMITSTNNLSALKSNELKKIQTDKKVSVSINDGLLDNHKETTSNKSSQQTHSSQPDIIAQSNNNGESTIEINQNDTEEDEQDHSELSEPLEVNSNHSEATSDNEIQSNDERLSHSSNSSEQFQQISSNETSENNPPKSTEESSPKSSRLSYSIKELLSKRTVPLAQKRPANLKFVREIEVEKQKIIDGTSKFLRDVRSILNKLTPQTKTKLIEQLEKLELDRNERLVGMIDIIFSKAVEEPKYCSMYAELCDNFQKKQVTEPDENGQMKTYSFRQILLTRCQKGFENDYRQEINYDQRKQAVDAITDEKLQKEEAENLEEALNKAKRRNFGNILFIGELFKLGMLTETIMYDCMDNLLQDKTDEENLECLCRLLRTIGKKFDEKKSPTQKKIEKVYSELNEIVEQRQRSARTRFMIQDLLEMRQAKWVARLAEAKPVTIDEIHEQDRLKREQEDQRRQQQPRPDQYRNNSGVNNNYVQNNPPLYTGSRGSRGSGSKQQPNRPNSDRIDKSFNVNSIRQYQSTDKKSAGTLPLNLKPQGSWPKVSTTEKKNDDDKTNTNRNTKFSNNSMPSFRPQANTSFRNSTQRPSLQASIQDNEDVNSNNNSMGNSREGSRVVSREQSRNTSPDSSSNKRSVPSSSATNQTFDEEKIQSRAHALSEEYTENYSETNDRPVKDAIDDLSDFGTSNTNGQAIIVRELLTNVLEGKPRARKAIGHLLGIALQQKILSNDGFLVGLHMVIEAVPDYIVDIPRIWQYIGEILGAFMAVTESNMSLLKSIFQEIPNEKSKQLFEFIIQYAVEFSSKSHIQKCWQLAGYTFDDLIKSDLIDSSFTNEYNWLSEQKENESSTNDNSIPCADLELVQLFKQVAVKNSSVTDADIHAYIQENMDPDSKFYIRNIVLSYLGARSKDHNEKKPLEYLIEKQGMKVLHETIHDKPEAELEAVYAIQNFVTKLGHPPKMAQFLFDKFYDEDCVTEEMFYEWRTKPDVSETDGHAEVVKSTEGFFNWLQTEIDDDKTAE